MPRKPSPPQTAAWASFEDLPDFIPPNPIAGDTSPAEAPAPLQTVSVDGSDPGRTAGHAMKIEPPAKSRLTFKARVKIVDAYHYRGPLTGAPDWVDRNWIGYSDGPVLKLPDGRIVRWGEWLVIESYEDAPEATPGITIYSDEIMRRLYIIENAG